MLKEVDKNMQETKQEHQIFGIIAGMDAKVEAESHQEPFIGGRHKNVSRQHGKIWRDGE